MTFLGFQLFYHISESTMGISDSDMKNKMGQMVNNQNQDQNTLLMPKEIMQSVNTGIIGDPITTNYKRKTEISHMSVNLAV